MGEGHTGHDRHSRHRANGEAMTSSTVKAEYISLQDAAILYAVSVDLLRHRIATGELPAVHAGRRLIRVRVDDLRRMFRPLPAARRYRRTA
jgi:hypothetical protein